MESIYSHTIQGLNNFTLSRNKDAGLFILLKTYTPDSRVKIYKKVEFHLYYIKDKTKNIVLSLNKTIRISDKEVFSNKDIILFFCEGIIDFIKSNIYDRIIKGEDICNSINTNQV